ncbi:MAG: hypothetical protein J0L97_10905 [Alphaproteobacteria bacterium]|nr:hypothetical protein [Alphaproteobacteria bacterium]
MPQPLRGRLSEGTTQGSHVLRARLNCAALIGILVAEWASLEDNLTFMFGIATADIVREPSPSFIFHPVAMAVMSTLDSLNARLNVISTSLEKILPQDQQNEFDTLATSIRKLARSRNLVVHGQWGINARYPNEIILIENRENYILYNEIDFNDIIDRIIRKSGDILQFSHNVQEYLTSQ